MALSTEEKKRFLKALEEDEEFRYAVAARLGLLEILNELKKLREDFNKFMKESSKRFETIERKLLEHDKRFEAIERELQLHRRLIEYYRRDIGALTEATISRFVYEDLRELIRGSGEKIVFRRRNIKVDKYDVDLLIETDKRVCVVEVKIQPNHHVVDELLEKGVIIKKLYGKPVKLVLAGIWIGDDVEDYATSKGIEVIHY